MVSVDYNDTVYSFNYGSKYPKWMYAIELSLATSGFLACLIPIIVMVTNSKGHYDSDLIFGLGGFSCIFFIIDLFFLCVLLYEIFIVKKSIIKCINANDAELITVVPFEYSETSGAMLISTYKVGVKFLYDGSNITMISKKFGVKKKFIGMPTQIVYSPSCNEVVLLKKK